MGLETLLIIAGILLLVFTTMHGLGFGLLIAGLVIVAIEIVIFLVVGGSILSSFRRDNWY